MDYLAVAVAGFLGAVSRAALGKLIKTGFPMVFPLGTIIVNLTGCFALSFLMNLTLERYRINPGLRLAIGTGFMGAYTTFSAFSIDSVNLIIDNHPFLALAYILATALGCVVSAWLGAVFSRVIVERQTLSQTGHEEGN